MRVCVAVSVLVSVVCGGCGRVGSRAAGALSRSAERRATAALGRDLERDAASKALQLEAPRRVFKYTTEGGSQRILQEGFTAGTHFTSKVSAGRPVTRVHAAERYGLPYAPEKRMTVRLPAGTDVTLNKVIGGAAGYGEVKIKEPLAAKAVTSVKDLRPTR